MALKEESLHQRSCQNLTLLPLPTFNLVLAQNFVHPLFVAFYNPTPYPSLPSQEYHPHILSLNLIEITCLHNLSLSIANLQYHLPREVLFSRENFLRLAHPFFYQSKQLNNVLNGFSSPQCLPLKGSPFRSFPIRHLPFLG